MEETVLISLGTALDQTKELINILLAVTRYDQEIGYRQVKCSLVEVVEFDSLEFQGSRGMRGSRGADFRTDKTAGNNMVDILNYVLIYKTCSSRYMTTTRLCLPDRRSWKLFTLTDLLCMWLRLASG